MRAGLVGGRSFLRLAVDEAPPDQSTSARTRRLTIWRRPDRLYVGATTTRRGRPSDSGKTIAIDATTLEANAAMRASSAGTPARATRRFWRVSEGLEGIETPTREGLARLDRKRKKKTSNKAWTNPHDPDREGHEDERWPHDLAHKAEHAVDMETGAIVAVTRQGADVGDTTTIIETAIAAAEQSKTRRPTLTIGSLWKRSSVITYHSNQTLTTWTPGYPVLRVRAGQGAT